MSILHIQDYFTILLSGAWRKSSIIKSLIFLLSFTFSATSLAVDVNDLPDSLPTHIEQSSTNNKTSPEKFTNQTPTINTPEYVIIRPSEQATFSSETAASVDKINVKVGSSFHINDVLLQLDCRVQEADLKKAQAQLETENMALTSARKLLSYGSISIFELTKAKSDQEIAKADVDKLTAIVEKCTIRAPFNGAVSELMVNAEETVKPGDPLLKIVSTDNLELEMQVPSRWLQWLHVGTQFVMHVNELNEDVNAKITKIDPQIDSISQTVRVFGVIIETNSKLLPGMSGQAIFPDNPEERNSQRGV